jgi:hypothetical protein
MPGLLRYTRRRLGAHGLVITRRLLEIGHSIKAQVKPTLSPSLTSVRDHLILSLAVDPRTHRCWSAARPLLRQSRQNAFALDPSGRAARPAYRSPLSRIFGDCYRRKCHSQAGSVNRRAMQQRLGCRRDCPKQESCSVSRPALEK